MAKENTLLATIQYRHFIVDGDTDKLNPAWDGLTVEQASKEAGYSRSMGFVKAQGSQGEGLTAGVKTLEGILAEHIDTRGAEGKSSRFVVNAEGKVWNGDDSFDLLPEEEAFALGKGVKVKIHGARLAVVAIEAFKIGDNMANRATILVRDGQTLKEALRLANPEMVLIEDVATTDVVVTAPQVTMDENP